MRKVLLDSNLLLLFLAGLTAPKQIGAHRRLRRFTEEDYRWLLERISGFPVQLTLPNIVTEVSNLIGSGKQVLDPKMPAALAWYCREIAEIYRESRLLANDPAFPQLGLADTAILQAAVAEVTVLTADHQLYGNLIKRGSGAINIWHHQTPK